MSTAAVVLLVLACIGHGYRIHTFTRQWQSTHLMEIQRLAQESKAALKLFLLAVNPRAAFTQSCLGSRVLVINARPINRQRLPGVLLVDRKSAYDIIQNATVLDPRDGTLAPALDGLGPKSLFVLMPQLGDFDSMEYAEQLAAVLNDLSKATLDLRIVAIGDAAAARRFANFWGLPLCMIRVDPNATLHRTLDLHAGPGWNAPEFVPADLQPSVKAWLNYLAMCLFISTPGYPWAVNFGTLREVFRGFLGDRSSPERLTPDTVVRIGPITLKAKGEYQIGPLKGDVWFWKEETGYLRPVELAAVRLRTIAEVLGNFNEYVKSSAHVAQRGATFIFQDGRVVYEWRDRGLLQYSETMTRPLSFLKQYIGPRALNPLQLGDASDS